MKSRNISLKFEEDDLSQLQDLAKKANIPLRSFLKEHLLRTLLKSSKESSLQGVKDELRMVKKAIFALAKKVEMDSKRAPPKRGKFRSIRDLIDLKRSALLKWWFV